MRPTGRVATMTRRATVSRLLTAGPAALLAEIGHQILRSSDHARHSDSGYSIHQSNAGALAFVEPAEFRNKFLPQGERGSE